MIGVKNQININIIAVFAAQAHDGQTRRDEKTPYIIHPARVVCLVRGYTNSFLAIAAAWLHDIIEDTDANLMEFLTSLDLNPQHILSIFCIVQSLTKGQDILEIRDRRTKAAVAFQKIIETRNNIRKWALLCKMCDRIDNICSINSNSRIDWTKQYLNETDLMIRMFGDCKEVMLRGSECYRAYSDLGKFTEEIKKTNR